VEVYGEHWRRQRLRLLASRHHDRDARIPAHRGGRSLSGWAADCGTRLAHPGTGQLIAASRGSRRRCAKSNRDQCLPPPVGWIAIGLGPRWSRPLVPRAPSS
jgi:hypothetical protein